MLTAPLLLAVLLAAGSLPDGYGAARWGMTPAQVRKAAPGLQGPLTRLWRSGEVFERPARVEYVFVKGRLQSVEVLFTATHTEAGGYLLEYERVRDTLARDLGQTGTSFTDWSDEEFRDKVDRPTALGEGHLQLRTVWENPRTRITLRCGTEDSDVALRASFERLQAPVPSPSPRKPPTRKR